MWLVNMLQNLDAFCKRDLEPIKNLSTPLQKRLYVTSEFGQRYNSITRFYNKEAFHTNIALRASYDTVQSIADGIISKEGNNKRVKIT